MGRVHKSPPVPRRRCVASHGFMRVKVKEKRKRKEADAEREEMESGGRMLWWICIAVQEKQALCSEASESVSV